jgi:hypothetical protein
MGKETAALGAATIDIDTCPACRQRHEEVKLHPYVNAQPPFTHWYSCPENTDPVPLTIAMHNGLPNVLNSGILRNLIQAHLHGNYLVMITSLPQGAARLVTHRHTLNFQRERAAEATSWVLAELEAEAGILPKPDKPLTPAKLEFLQPLRSNDLKKVDGFPGELVVAEAVADAPTDDESEQADA